MEEASEAEEVAEVAEDAVVMVSVEAAAVAIEDNEIHVVMEDATIKIKGKRKALYIVGLVFIEH